MKTRIITVCFLFLHLLFAGCSKEEAIDNVDPDVPEVEISEEEMEIAIQNLERVEEAMSPLFLASENAEELAQHLDEIKAMEGVEDAWVENISTCWIEIENGGLVLYYFPQEPLEIENSGKEENIDMNIKVQTKSDFNSNVCENKNVCFINQTSNDIKFGYVKSKLKELKQNFEAKGFHVTIINNEEFDVKALLNIAKYGITFLVTHGTYQSVYNDKGYRHWIITGQQFFSKEDTAKWSKKEFAFTNSKERFGISEQDIVSKHYIAVSDVYIGENIGNFYPNSILFNVACSSLRMNNDLWNFLKKKQLGCYLGFDNTNSIGVSSGSVFFNYLLSGKNVSDAYKEMELYYIYEFDEWAELECHPSDCQITLFGEPEVTDEEAVDLGLSVKWAKKNLGASNYTDKGNGYEDYKYMDIYYEDPILVGEDGEDVNLSGNEKYDYARKELGGSWRMPTFKDWQELKEKCTWKTATIDDKPGFLVTGPNGKNIFLPGKQYQQPVMGIQYYDGLYATGTLNQVGLRSFYIVGSMGPYGINTCQIEDMWIADTAFIRPVCD